MKCISPICLKKGVFVPCGVCAFCLSQKRDDWTFRIQESHRHAHTAHFLTFTYQDDSLVFDVKSRLDVLVPEHLTLMFKRLRWYSDQAWKQADILPLPKIKYYACGEYGGAYERPHYHAIIFNMANECLDKLDVIWPHGHVDIGNVEARSIHYVTGHQIQRYRVYPGRVRPFARMSKGIGVEYVERAKWWHKGNGELRNYVMHDGFQKSIPQYLKKKIFSRHEREQIALMNVENGINAYWKEINDIKAKGLHVNPTAYYDERRKANHEILAQRQKKAGKGKTGKL